MEMALVPAGCFMMGSTDAQIDYFVSLGSGRSLFSDEQPAAEICFDVPFWIDRYEVTIGQFTRLGGQAARGSRTGDDLPRERITWFEARDFCEQRGGRLPTEAEWEYAARGPDNLMYPWGNDFVADNVVYSGNSGNQTAAVGSRPGGVSWVGAQDLSGNVWEWVSTIYQDYPYSATDGRENNSDTRDIRGLRGGSYYDMEYNLRTADRSGTYSDNQDYNYGFRCARSYSGNP